MAICSPLLMPFRSHLTHNLVQTSAFFFGALCLAIPSGYSYGPVLLSIMSLFVFWRADYWLAMSREAKILFWIFIFYFMVQAISISLDNGALKELDVIIQTSCAPRFHHVRIRFGCCHIRFHCNI